MSIVSPARFRPLLWFVLTVVAGALVAATVGLAPPGSAAPAALRPEAGYHLPGGDFAGFYVTRSGAKVYCIDPGKRAPSTVALRPITRYRGMTRRTADQLAYALSSWGNARTRAQAAAESQLVNTIVGNAAAVRRRSAGLPRAVRRTVAAHLRLVRARSGPYTLQVRARTAAPGQTATGTATLVSGTRVGVPGTVVRLRGSGNVAVPAAVRTGARGSASFRYTVTGAGPVRIDAGVSGLAPARFTGTHPAAGRQRMVTWAPAVSATAQLVFQARPGAFTHNYQCSTTCDGHPRTTLRACAAPSTYASRIVYRAGARAAALDFPAGTRTRCRSIVLVLIDQDRVTAAWMFHGPHGWTPQVAAAGTFVVDCPPVPPVEVSLRYDCTRGAFAAAVAGRPGHPVVLIVSGAAARRVPAGATDVARFTASVQCGTTQTYGVQAGVQRADGTWNYGPVARVVTPGAARQP